MERIIYPYVFMFLIGGWVAFTTQIAYKRQKITRWDARFRQLIMLGTTIMFCMLVAVAVYLRISVFIIIALLLAFLLVVLLITIAVFNLYHFVSKKR